MAYISAVVEEQNLNSYNVDGNTFVNLLSKKKFTLTPLVYTEKTPNQYFVWDSQTYGISATNEVVVDFTNKEIVTTIQSGITRPTISAQINFTDGSVITEQIWRNTYTFINYQKPQFVPTTTTVRRNGLISGKVLLNIEGTYFNGEIGNVNQGGTYKPTIKYKFWKKEDTEPATYNYTIPSTSIDVNNGIFSVTNYEIGNDDTSAANYFNPSYSYKVKLYVEDTFIAISSSMSNEVEKDLTNGEPIWTEYADRVEFKKIVAGNIDCGSVSITPTANTPTSESVTFNKTFASPPIVIATAESSVIGSVVRGVSVANVTTTGCDIYIYRTNNTSTNVNWIAIG